jgi:hypothetical protein
MEPPTSSCGAIVKKEQSPEKQLASFLAKYSPEIRALALRALAKMRARLPGAVELVYDNYNALAIAFGPTERLSDVIFSITLYPRWVSLFFRQGAGLPDPRKLLKGSGRTIRHIVLDNAAVLDTPAVRALIAHALQQAPKPIDSTEPNRVVIKSVSKKQRPRRRRDRTIGRDSSVQLRPRARAAIPSLRVRRRNRSDRRWRRSRGGRGR